MRRRRTPGLRGRTRPGRLDAWNGVLVNIFGDVLRARPGAPVVDVGIGDQPHTAVELADALRAAGLENPVVAVDAVAARVDHARATVGPRADLRFAVADLRDLGAASAAPVAIRAANVLRQSAPDAVPGLQQALAGQLVPGGLLLEGSTDLDGTIGCFHHITAAGRRAGLVFTTTGVGGFAPVRFRDHLPRDLRGRVRATPALAALFDAWTAAFEAARARGIATPGALLAASVAATPALAPLPSGCGAPGACWAPPTGVPLPTPEP